MKFRYILAIAISLSATPVFASPQDPMVYSNFAMFPAWQEALEAEKTKACSAKPDASAYQIACREKLFMRGKRDLDKSYNRTSKWLNAPLRAELKNQQQRWLNNGSDECLLIGEGIHYPAEGRKGGEYELEQLNCLLTEQNRRTIWLNKIRAYNRPEFLTHPTVEPVKNY